MKMKQPLTLAMGDINGLTLLGYFVTESSKLCKPATTILRQSPIRTTFLSAVFFGDNTMAERRRVPPLNVCYATG
jgi:hypothetical protein